MPSHRRDVDSTEPPRFWPVETAAIDVGEICHCSLALDSQRQPMISFWRDVETDTPRLMFARRGGDGWRAETVTEVRGVSTHLALDPSDRPSIAFYDLDAGALRVARASEAGWAIVTVDEGLGGFAAGAVSAEFDAAGRPHAAYGGDSGLVVTRRTTEGLAREVVDAGSTTSFHSSLALARDGFDHVCYLDLTTGELRYAYRQNDGWHTGPVVEEGGGDFTWEFPCLAIDAEGRPQVSYWGAEGLRHARLVDGEWHLSKVDPGEGSAVGLYCSITLNGAGRPVIAYQDAETGSAKLARWVPGQWRVETVEVGAPGGSVGAYVSLALDSLQVPHLAYVDRGRGRLSYTRLDTPPAVVGDEVITFVNQLAQGNVLENDSDAEGDAFEVVPEETTGPVHGDLEIQADGDFTYTPHEGFHGADGFRYLVRATGGLTATAEVSIEVRIPVLVHLRIRETPNRRSTITIDVESSDPPAIHVVLQRLVEGEWVEVPQRHQGLPDFGIEPSDREWSTGPFRLTFVFAAGDYAVAFSEEFFFPPETGQRLFLEGSLVPSEPA